MSDLDTLRAAIEAAREYLDCGDGFSTWVAPGYCLNPTLWMPIPEVEEKKGEDQ